MSITSFLLFDMVSLQGDICPGRILEVQEIHHPNWLSRPKIPGYL
jgi:hypothetical protein